MVSFFYQHWDQLLSVQMQDASDYPAHFHHQIELYYLIKGEQELTIDEQTCVLHAGDAALVLPNCVHSQRNIRPGRSVVAVFDASYTGAYMRRLQSSVCAYPFIQAAHSDVMLALLRLARDDSMDDALSAAYVSLAVGRLLSALELTPRGTVAETDDLKRVLAYIDTHIGEKITLEAIAGSIGLNRYAVSRLFSERMHCGLNEYVNALRADRARHLLRETALPLSEISRRSGFDSERTFYRAFREQYGASPREYARASTEAERADKTI